MSPSTEGATPVNHGFLKGSNHSNELKRHIQTSMGKYSVSTGWHSSVRKEVTRDFVLFTPKVLLLFFCT